MIYFDNAATTYPKPDTVIRAVNGFIKDKCGNPGRSGHSLSMAAADEVYDCRKKAARFFGAADPSRVCFCGGCTEALNTAIFGCINRGDKVITSDIEHNSVRRPIIAAGAETVFFDAFADKETILAEIEDRIDKGAKAVVCSCASNVFPLVMPYREIGALCREKGVIFIADAAQAAGVYDIDVIRDNIDILCVPAHKGLYGITGCGMMILSPSFDASRLKPLLYGGSGINSFESDMPPYPPERFEGGTLPTVGISALSAGLDFVTQTGIDAIRKKEHEICALILSGLSGCENITVYHKNVGSVLCFNLNGTPSEQTGRLLDGYGICARAGFHCAPGAHKYTAPDGAVRISFSVFNTKNETERFISVIKRISRS